MALKIGDKVFYNGVASTIREIEVPNEQYLIDDPDNLFHSKIVFIEELEPVKPLKIHHGAVCSYCGVTVTEDEYSMGSSFCCKKDVISEEEYAGRY